MPIFSFIRDESLPDLFFISSCNRFSLIKIEPVTAVLWE
jgi:hypothetical protein